MMCSLTLRQVHKRKRMSHVCLCHTRRKRTCVLTPPFSLPFATCTRQGSIDASPADRAQKEIEAIYKEHNPDKIGDVPRLLLKYAGREDMLVRAIKEKYKEAGKAEKE